MAEKYNLTVRKGDDLLPFNIRAEDIDPYTGETSPVDMTGYSVHFDIVIGEFNTQGEAVIDDGHITASIDHTITEVFPVGRGVYRIRVVSPVVWTVIEGTITVTEFDGDQ